MKERIIRSYLKERKLDALVLFNRSPGFSYFSGGDFEHGLMIITRKKNILYLSPLYSPRLKGFKIVRWKKFKEDFKRLIAQNKIKRVGADYSSLLVLQKRFLSRHFKVRDSSDFISGLRETKTIEEMARIRQACRITDSIFTGIVKGLRSKNFRTETDISRFIKIKALEAGSEMAFEPIVASGKNATIAHHDCSIRSLNKGFLVLDFGVKYKSYMSDMTRTIYLGTPKEKDIRIYRKIKWIQEECIAKLKAGMKAGFLFNYSLKLFGKDAKYFNHGLGHGFGVEIHEKPSISHNSKDRFENRTVVTIEPGYYNKSSGIGIRIEDDIYLGHKKEVLTGSHKDLICINNFKA